MEQKRRHPVIKNSSSPVVLLFGRWYDNDYRPIYFMMATFISERCRCPSVVCLSSVTFVRPTQAVQIFGNISTALGALAIH